MQVIGESEKAQAARALAFQTIVSTAPEDRSEEAFAASIEAYWRGESLEMWRAEFCYRILSGSKFLNHSTARPH